MIRHSYLRATLLLAFLLLHAPGYGLHALVGIEHVAKPSPSCGGCAFCVLDQRPDESRQRPTEQERRSASVPPSPEPDNCCVCKLLATLAIVESETKVFAVQRVTHRNPLQNACPETANRACYFARGPPA